MRKTKHLPPFIKIICYCFLVFGCPPQSPPPQTRKPNSSESHYKLSFPFSSCMFQKFSLFMEFSIFPLLLLECWNFTWLCYSPVLLYFLSIETAVSQRVLPPHLASGVLLLCPYVIPDNRYLSICRIFNYFLTWLIHTPQA